jgi:hypothetical protein
MSENEQFPPALLARASGLLLSGRVHFSKDVIGEAVHSTS